ncbi:hypothetical protein BHE74_00047426, partial [Ensete ventricosum]
DHPKHRICKGSNTWYQSNVLSVSLPFIIPPQLPKQFPQLLRSSLNSTIISTTADHILISLRIATSSSFVPYYCSNLVIFHPKTQKNCSYLAAETLHHKVYLYNESCAVEFNRIPLLVLNLLL